MVAYLHIGRFLTPDVGQDTYHNIHKFVVTMVAMDTMVTVAMVTIPHTNSPLPLHGYHFIH